MKSPVAQDLQLSQTEINNHHFSKQNGGQSTTHFLSNLDHVLFGGHILVI